MGPGSIKHLPSGVHLIERGQEIRHGHCSNNGETPLGRIPIFGEGSVLMPRRRRIYRRYEADAGVFQRYRIPLSAT